MKEIGKLEDGNVLVSVAPDELAELRECREKAEIYYSIAALMNGKTRKALTPANHVPKPRVVPRKRVTQEKKPAPEKPASKDEDGKKSPPMVAVLRAEADREGANVTKETGCAMLTKLGYKIAVGNVGVMLASSPKYFARVDTGIYRAKSKMEMLKEADEKARTAKGS